MLLNCAPTAGPVKFQLLTTALLMITIASFCHIIMHIGAMFSVGIGLVWINQYLCALACFSEQRSGHIKQAWSRTIHSKCLNYAIYTVVPIALCQTNNHWLSYILGLITGLVVFNGHWLVSLRNQYGH